MYLQDELWKDIPHYEGRYLVSNYGRVFSLLTHKIMATRLNNDGYEVICLNPEKGKRKSERVHRLVALAFIPNPNGYPEVNHINGIRNDNRAINLEWMTHEQNNQHKIKLGTTTAKPLLCIDTGQVFNGSGEASRCLGGDAGNIRNSARLYEEGKVKTVNGHRYRWLSSEELEY